MNGKDIKEIIKTVLSLFLICTVAAGLLATVNSITAPEIAANNQQRADEARKTVVPDATSFEETATADGTIYHIAFKNSEKVAYIFTTSAKGYGGDISVLTAISPDGKITAVSVLEINETPGLGMKVKSDSFLNQFTGKAGKLSLIKSGTPAENEIDAITSATISSSAVTNAVNTASDIYNEIISGEVE